jgi:putative DNA primase/helicase
MSALDRVTNALAAHGSTVQRGMGRCLAHADTTASLSVSQGREGALLKCHAGCSTHSILSAIGLTTADLFDSPKAKRADDKPVIVETYPYRDEAGELLYEAVRYVNAGRMRPALGIGNLATFAWWSTGSPNFAPLSKPIRLCA